MSYAQKKKAIKQADPLIVLTSVVFSSIFRFPWYVRNETFHQALKMEPIRKINNHQTLLFCNNIYPIPNPKILNLPIMILARRPEASVLIVPTKVLPIVPIVLLIAPNLIGQRLLWLFILSPLCITVTSF